MPDSGAQKLWEAALGELQLQVPRPSYDTWLKDTRGHRQDNGTLFVGVPSAFVAAWLEQRMYSLIERAVEHVARRPLGIQFVVPSFASQPMVAASTAASDLPQDPGPAQGEGGAPAHHSPRFSFSSFVVGKSNQFAFSAAMSVSKGSSLDFNPLSIYSDVGLGKTHLLQSIFRAVSVQGRRAQYVTAEQFTNEFIVSVQQGTAAAFRERYRQLDVLLVDDIQFIAGKEHSQEALFHTFNHLQSRDCQVVIASDRPPHTLSLLQGRLRSRFEGGLQADIRPPGPETSLAILRAKALSLRPSIPDEVLCFIAERDSHQNVRQLLGALTRLAACCEFTGETPSLSLAQSLLPSLPSVARPVPADRVISCVAQYYHLDPGSLLGRQRDGAILLARQVAMFLLHKDHHYSVSHIARVFGKDHSTVLHSCSKLSRLLLSGSGPQDALAALRSDLSSTPRA